MDKRKFKFKRANEMTKGQDLTQEDLEEINKVEHKELKDDTKEENVNDIQANKLDLQVK